MRGFPSAGIIPPNNEVVGVDTDRRVHAFAVSSIVFCPVRQPRNDKTDYYPAADRRSQKRVLLTYGVLLRT
jgi:hypothetical protein